MFVSCVTTVMGVDEKSDEGEKRSEYEISMNIHLGVAILIFGDSNHYLNEKKQCANEFVWGYRFFAVIQPRIRRGIDIISEGGKDSAFGDNFPFARCSL